MTNVLNIARYELRRIFLSPLAWAVLAIVQFIMGFVFINLLVEYAANAGMGNDQFGVSDYIGGSLYGFATILLLLVMPLMTMRLFAEERKSNSLTLLFSAPVSLTEIVLGKFAGLLGFIGVVILLMALMPLALNWSTDLDWGRIVAGLLGLFLLMMSFGAAGLFVSSCTREPTIAAVGSFGLLLVVWLLNILAYNDSIPFKELFGYLSLIDHYESLRRGVFDTADAIYYVLFSALFLSLTVLRLDMERN
ncbi:MAG: ABC transporter permease [Sinimarinibacterium flocculans]|uniref:ABC-2 type transport system permease protein n=1 Tax=Sinimarinibacterium flocculans TaxID=985250 RepID=A0A318E4Q8_9GAMM|nr:ABC transporter permease [Sinimarinibacterium flocculans]MEC9363651.1 ABC transporter permease [Pseudomonadota bacterium]PXV64913.1 ABC-2 type transport system permease protein [Sinimarinibacterium flocculans]